MTKDEILDMLAGIEMDALIAQKIMRLKLEGNAHYWANGAGALLRIPKYSTSIAAAWEIVEKFESQGWAWKIETDLNSVMCEFANLNDHTKYIKANGGSSVPFAICRAALLSMENND